MGWSLIRFTETINKQKQIFYIWQNIYKSKVKTNNPVAEKDLATIIALSSRDENLHNRPVVRHHSFNTWYKLVWQRVCLCVCLSTFGLPEAGLLTLLQLTEAVAVSFAATVDEGSAGLNFAVEVPAQRVSTTGPLLHGQQAQVCWSCTTHTQTYTHEECAHIDKKKTCTIEKSAGWARRSRGTSAIKTKRLVSMIVHFLRCKITH